MIRVLIADDHAVVRQGLRLFLDVLPDVEVVGEAEDGGAAVALARELRPDVVVMDVVMPQVDGVEATKALHEEAPAVKVLALSTFGDEDHVLPTLAAGAVGFLTKDTRPEEIGRRSAPSTAATRCCAPRRRAASCAACTRTATGPRAR